MVFFFGELFGLFAELFFLGAASQGTQDRTSQPDGERELDVLERAAHLLDGSVHDPWLRKARILGHYRGRDVQVIALGGGKVEVRCKAQRGVELSAHVPLLSRLFGDREPKVEANASRFAGWAFDLFRRYDGIRLTIRDGALVARGRPGLDAQRIHDFTAAVVTLAWEEAPRPSPWTAEPASPIRVQERTAGGGPDTGSPPPSAGLRCPFCHDDLLADKPVVQCDACDAPHHPSCFEEGEGCSIQGCKHRKARGVRS